MKTRLAREVGISEATRFYRATTRAMLERLGRQPFWETILSISPDGSLHTRLLPRGPKRMRQGGGDLGARMQRPMRDLPPGPVCVIGTDIPAIRVADVRKAFRLLGRCDAAFGPAEDGGFWLVGQRRRPRVTDPYRGVGWSRADTLVAVLANLAGHAVGLTTRLSDVDGAADLALTRGAFGRVVQPFRSSAD